MKVNKAQCPTREEIDYHINKANSLFPDVVDSINDLVLLSSDEELRLNETEFDDAWTFSLIMEMCANKYYNSGIVISYIRSDGKNCAAIGITNLLGKLNRLLDERDVLKSMIKNMETGSSMYKKTIDEIERLTKEFEKYKEKYKI